MRLESVFVLNGNYFFLIAKYRWQLLCARHCPPGRGVAVLPGMWVTSSCKSDENCWLWDTSSPHTLLKKFNSHLIKCICQFYIPEYMGTSVPYKSCQSNDRRGGIEPGREGVVPLSMLTMFSPPFSICPTSLPQTPELWMWDRYDHSISQEKKQMFKEIVT